MDDNLVETLDFDLDPDPDPETTKPWKTHIRGRIQPENSLMILVDKRAKSGFKGFVDVTTLASVTSPHNRGVRILNEVCNPPESDSSFLKRNFEEQLKSLNHPKYGATAKQLLLTDTLLHFDYDRNISAIADCLLADDCSVMHDAAARLERIMIATKHNDIVAAKNQLLKVAERTYQVIADLDADQLTRGDHHFRMCGHLHIVAMCALLCRDKYHPTLEDCRSFMAWPKLNRKRKGDDVRQEVLKQMHAFYEQVERHLREQKIKSTVPVCTNIKKFPKAKFFEQTTSFFLLLNRLAEDEWSDKGKELLTEMTGLYGTIKDPKRLTPEAKAGIDTLLIRGLIAILSTTFAKVREQVGEGSFEHPLLIAKLLASIVAGVGGVQLRNFLPALGTIAFHECPKVRSVITELLQKFSYPPLHTIVDYMEAAIRVADFHLDLRSDGKASGGEDACSWHALRGRFGQKPAECFVFVHTGKCESKTLLSSDFCDQLKKPDSGEGQRHRQNLEVLAKLSPHDHLVKLMAFQLTPFLFYATENIKGRRLLEHLINHRAAHRWLDTATLCRVMYDVITGLEYLASKDFASRDVTAYDMLVAGQSRRGGIAGEMMDILMTKDFTIKLTNFELAHYFRDKNRKEVRPVQEQGAIPLLWTPREALLKGEYGEQSMVYSAGCVMYELWTHGCQPFTTYQKSTADTVRMMLLTPDNVPLIPWPCIPEDVYDIMKQCTSSKANERPCLRELKQKFMEMHCSKLHKNESHGFEVEGGKEQTYPSFCDDQIKRKHVPEKGIPPEIQQIINDYRINKSESYRNMRQSRWVDYAASFQVSATSELNSPHWTEIAYFEDYTSVRENYTATFVRDQLPLLLKCAAHARGQLPGLTDWLKSRENQPSLDEYTDDQTVHERRYKPSWTLLDAACKGLLATSESGYTAMTMDRYVHVLLTLSRAVHALHEAGWLHRDIRASNVLVDCGTGQARLVRLGRMYYVGSPTGRVFDEPFQDTWRWLAPEVLSEGQYMRENDVFMLGTVFWEVFRSREVTENCPTATEVYFLPFADEDKSKIASLITKEKTLPKPAACPDWLYQLSVKCRHFDRSMRPTTEDIIDILQKQLTQPIDPDRSFLPHPKLLSALHCQRPSANEEPIPEIPARSGPKHAAPLRSDSGLAAEALTMSASRGSAPNVLSICLSGTSGDAMVTSNHFHTSKSGYLTPVSPEIEAARKKSDSGQASESSGVSPEVGLSQTVLQSVSRRSTVNVRYTDYSEKSGGTVAASDHSHTNKSGYSTLFSPEIQAAQDSKREKAESRRASETSGVAPEADFSKKVFRSASEAALPDNRLGLCGGLKDKGQGPTVDKLVRKIPRKQSDPSGLSAKSLKYRSMPLPPLPVDDELHVYNEIKDQARPERQSSATQRY